MEDDENNEEVDNTDKDEDTQSKEHLKELNEYVQQMAYKPVEPPHASERTEALAKAPKKYILGTYAEHKDNFQPKERSERIQRIVEKHTPMTIENLEDFIRKYRKKQAQQEKNKKLQQTKYHEILLKLQKQCENQVMNAIVHKFAKFVSKKASSIKSPSSTLSSSNVETESYQRLQNSLVCYMISSLDIPNIQQSSDLSMYKKLATVLADLILQALFLAHKSDWVEQNCAGGDEEQLGADSNARDQEIKLRALRAAKKKLYHQSRKKSSKGYAVLSHCLNK